MVPEVGRYDAQARRVDVILRARFPNLNTRIFEIRPHVYQIVFDKNQQDAAAISQEFDQKIRFATLHVSLSNTLPHEYVREIANFSEREVAGSMAGLLLRKFDAFNILATRFPDLPIVDVESDFKRQRLVIDLSC